MGDAADGDTDIGEPDAAEAPDSPGEAALAGGALTARRSSAPASSRRGCTCLALRAGEAGQARLRDGSAGPLSPGRLPALQTQGPLPGRYRGR